MPTEPLHGLHDTGVVIAIPPVIEGEGWRLDVSSEYVPAGDRLVPMSIRFDAYGDADSPTTSALIEVRDGVPRVVDVRIYAREGEGEVRATHLREIEVDAMVDLLAGFAVQVRQGQDELVVEWPNGPGDLHDEISTMLRRLRANRRITPAFLQEIADVYRANIRHAPTRAIKERYFVSDRMASRYVQMAREAGKLPPTTPGRKKA